MQGSLLLSSCKHYQCKLEFIQLNLKSKQLDGSSMIEETLLVLRQSPDKLQLRELVQSQGMGSLDSHLIGSHTRHQP